MTGWVPLADIMQAAARRTFRPPSRIRWGLGFTLSEECINGPVVDAYAEVRNELERAAVLASLRPPVERRPVGWSC